MGGAIAAVEIGYMKSKLVESNTARLEAIERGELTVVGVNRFTETEPSPLTTGDDAILTVSHGVEAEQIERLKAWRAARDAKAVATALKDLQAAAREGRNIMPPSIAAPKPASPPANGAPVCAKPSANIARRPASAAPPATTAAALTMYAPMSNAYRKKLGRRIKLLVGKPGLDGHSNGAEQIAVRARDAGMEVVYDGIRLTPAEIVNAALEEGVHVVGLSILSGSHVPLVKDVVAAHA